MVNLPQEAVYWTATVDGAGQTLTGGHDYRLHFPLSTGPQVLHVPDMAGRYYSVQLTDPRGTGFAYVSRWHPGQ